MPSTASPATRPSLSNPPLLHSKLPLLDQLCIVSIHRPVVTLQIIHIVSYFFFTSSLPEPNCKRGASPTSERHVRIPANYQNSKRRETGLLFSKGSSDAFRFVTLAESAAPWPSVSSTCTGRGCIGAEAFGSLEGCVGYGSENRYEWWRASLALIRRRGSYIKNLLSKSIASALAAVNKNWSGDLGKFPTTT